MSANPFKPERASVALAQSQHASGWTPDEFLPHWIAAGAYWFAVGVRKVWGYACAPFGAVVLLILWVTK